MDFVKDNYYAPCGHGEEFTVNINMLPTSFNNYFEESIVAAREIEAQKVGKLHLLYSGGVDSENVLGVFLSAGIPITPVIISMAHGHNSFDTHYAFQFCKSKHIQPLVINVDFDRFVTSGKMLETARICKSSIYHRTLTAYIAGTLDGTVLCGDGEMYIRKNKQRGCWDVHMDEHEFAVYRFFQAKGIHGTTHFNTYRPEMMSAMITDVTMRELADNKRPHKEGSNSSKVEIYNRHSNFNLARRPKFHGYEQIELSPTFNHPDFATLRDEGKQWNGSYDVEYYSFLERHSLCKR